MTSGDSIISGVGVVGRQSLLKSKNPLRSLDRIEGLGQMGVCRVEVPQAQVRGLVVKGRLDTLLVEVDDLSLVQQTLATKVHGERSQLLLARVDLLEILVELVGLVDLVAKGSHGFLDHVRQTIPHMGRVLSAKNMISDNHAIGADIHRAAEDDSIGDGLVVTVHHGNSPLRAAIVRKIRPLNIDLADEDRMLAMNHVGLVVERVAPQLKTVASLPEESRLMHRGVRFGALREGNAIDVGQSTVGSADASSHVRFAFCLGS